MKKRIISLLVSMLLLCTICIPAGAIESNQIKDSEVIATDEFVVYLTDNRSRLTYPLNVRTLILYTESDGLGFCISAVSGVPIITGLNGFVEYNTSLDADHGIVKTYSESSNPARSSIEWMEYTGNKYSSGVKITASFVGEVSADKGLFGDDVDVDGYFHRTVEATIP